VFSFSLKGIVNILGGRRGGGGREGRGDNSKVDGGRWGVM